MDSGRFDDLARQLSSRRTALGGLLTGLLVPLDVAAGKKDKRRKGHRRGNGKGKSGVRAQDGLCWRAGACQVKKGANVSQCDLDGYTAPDSLDCTGCNLSRANLRDADLSGVTFNKANLSGACLVDADFTDATFARNTNLANAVYCRTTMPDGTTNDSGCDSGTECCLTCIPVGRACGDDIGGDCCADTQCINGICQGCVPATCSNLGKNCGSHPDGCGGTLTCGNCTAGTCQTATCTNGVCAISSISGAQGPNCTGSGQLCCNGGCVNTASDRFNCGRCNNFCSVTGAACLSGTCGCPADGVTCSIGDLVLECREVCSAQPGYYQGRFQSCYGPGGIHEGDCAACIGWAGCHGALDTGTVCGTQTGTCDI